MISSLCKSGFLAGVILLVSVFVSVMSFAQTAEKQRSDGKPINSGDVSLQLPEPPSFMSKKPVSKISRKERRRQSVPDICKLIEASAQNHAIPPGFLARLLWQESRFNTEAVSPKGALGIAQFMPATARERGLAEPLDPEQAIPASAAFLSELLMQFGNLGLAAAAYNAGPNRVAVWRTGKNNLPFETRNFVWKITGISTLEWKNTKALEADFTLKKGVSFLEACSLFPIKTYKVNTPGVSVRWQPWGVHLIAHRSRAKAISIYREIQREQPGLLKGVEPMVLVMRRNSFGRAPRYAVRVGKPNEVAAINLCRKLRSAGGACLIYKTPR